MLYNLHTGDIVKHAGQLAGLNINGRIINNFRRADDTVLLLESEQELQDLLLHIVCDLSNSMSFMSSSSDNLHHLLYDHSNLLFK